MPVDYRPIKREMVAWPTVNAHDKGGTLIAPFVTTRVPAGVIHLIPHLFSLSVPGVPCTLCPLKMALPSRLISSLMSLRWAGSTSTHQ